MTTAVFSLGNIDPRRLYSRDEAARLIPGKSRLPGFEGAVHPITVDCMRRDGRLRGVRSGGRWSYLGSDLIRFLQGPDPDPTVASSAEDEAEYQRLERESREIG